MMVKNCSLIQTKKKIFLITQEVFYRKVSNNSMLSYFYRFITKSLDLYEHKTF